MLKAGFMWNAWYQLWPGTGSGLGGAVVGAVAQFPCASSVCGQQQCLHGVGPSPSIAQLLCQHLVSCSVGHSFPVPNGHPGLLALPGPVSMAVVLLKRSSWGPCMHCLC